MHIPPATLSNKQYSPFTGFISYLNSLIKLFKYAPPSPLAFITILAFKFSPLFKLKLYPLSSLFISITASPNLNSTSFSTAFSPNAKVISYGLTIPEVLTCNAPTTS